MPPTGFLVFKPHGWIGQLRNWKIPNEPVLRAAFLAGQLHFVVKTDYGLGCYKTIISFVFARKTYYIA